MIQLIPIKDKGNNYMPQLLDLYVTSFPSVERRDLKILEEMIAGNDKMTFNAIVEEGVLCGLFVYWNFESFWYGEHLAIFPEMRNRKIGEKVLEHLKEQIKQPQILEVEPIADEMSERRINFYRRNGFEIVDKSYVQPAYNANPNDSLPMWIMSRGEMSAEALQNAIRTIKQEVYNYFD